MKDKKTITVPLNPPRALLVSMAIRFDHAFLMKRQEMMPGTGIFQGYTPEQRESLIRQMSQLYEEVIGTGFYKWDGSKDDLYKI